MKCPYIVDTIKTDRPSEPIWKTHEWEKNGEPETSITWYIPTTELTQTVMHDCLQEDCGAWETGRCVYNKPGGDQQ